MPKQNTACALLRRTFNRFTLKVFVVVALFLLIAPLYTYTREHLRSKPAVAAVGINRQISFQGKLVNPDGTNVTDGSYSIVFSIYTVASAGTNIWTETQSVTLSNGIFQVNLGSVTTLPGSVDFNTDNIYLGIKVGADAEMTPRIQFTAVPQAFNAEKLGGLDKTGFIQNTISQQLTSNFNISGSGVVGSSLTTPVLQSAASTALTITANAASTWSTTAGNLTLQTGGTGNIILNAAGTIELQDNTNITGTLAVTGALTVATLQNAGALNISATATAGADDIIFNTAGTEKMRILENGNLFFEKGANDVTLAVSTPGAAATYTLSGASGTIYTDANHPLDTIAEWQTLCTNCVSLTGDVTGILGATNGGTGNGFTAFTGPTASTKTFTLPDASATILTSNAAVTVLQGGTGSTTAQGAINNLSGLTTEGDLLYRNATNSTRLARGTNGQCLTSNTTTIIWGSCGAGVTTVGTFSGSSQVNGASIAGSTITFGPADATNPGMVSTAAQTFAGTKTFTGDINVNGNGIFGTGAGNTQIKFNYSSGGGGDFTGQMAGADQLSFGFNNSATYGGSAGAASGRLIYFYDRVANAFRGGINALGDLYWGANTTSYGLKVAQVASGTGLTIDSTGGGSFGSTLQVATLGTASNDTVVCRNGTNQLATCTSTFATTTQLQGYVQLAPASVQADATTNSSVFINKTGASGNILQLQKNGTDQLVLANNGTLTVTGNTVLGANSTLRITGGNTAGRPVSPSEGTIYFDTDTKQLLVYGNAAWQNMSRSSTKVVAASNSQTPAGADYQVTAAEETAGNADSKINAAIAALPAGGGTVYLMEGTYTIDTAISLPSNVTLSGAGASTIIKLKNGINADIQAMVNSDPTNGNNRITLRDFRVDGNKANNTSGLQRGIEFTNVGSGSGATAVPGAKINNLLVENFRDRAISLITSNNNIVSGNTVLSNSGTGIRLQSSNNNTVTGNLSQGNGSNAGTAGIALATSSYNTVTGNTSEGNTGQGIYLFTSTYNTVSGNTSRYNTNDGIAIATSSTHNTITGNNVIGNFYGIEVDNSTSNTVSSNTVQGSGNNAMRVSASHNNTLTGNTVSGNNSGFSLISASSGNTISSNNVYQSSFIGISLNSAINNSITGNTVQGNGTTGISLFGSANSNVVSGNKVHDNGAALGWDNVYVGSSDSNTITGNNITDTTGTGYAINVSDAASDTTYLSDNTYSGTGASTIQDLGTGTIYGGQLDSANNFLVNPAANIELQSNTNVIGDLDVSGALNVGTTNAFSVSSGGTLTFTGVATDITTGTNQDLTVEANGTGQIVLNDTVTVSTLSTAGIVTNTAGGVLGTVTSIPIANGGTGSTTAQGAINNLSGLTTEGDLLYRNATNSTRLARGTNGQCLTSNTTTIVWGSCGSGGITSLDGQTGPSITINNATGSANVITIDDATTAAKGIASFNSSFFTATSGAISLANDSIGDTQLAFNTGQNLTTTSSPAFTAVSTATLQNAGALNISATATAGADDIIFNTAGTEKMRILENGNLFFEKGANDVTLAVSTPGAAATYTLSGASGTIYTDANHPLDTIAEWQTLCTNCVSLTGDVTGILGATNGGTGNGFTAFTGPTASTKTFTLPDASATILTSNAAVTVLQGGTGSTTAQGAINNLSGLTTEGDLLYRNATNSTRLARGTNGQCLTSNTTTIIWGSCGAGVTTVGTFSGSSQVNGASIAGSTITFGPADATNPGMVSTAAQTFAGDKTFNGDILFTGGFHKLTANGGGGNGILQGYNGVGLDINISNTGGAGIQAVFFAHPQAPTSIYAGRDNTTAQAIQLNTWSANSGGTNVVRLHVAPITGNVGINSTSPTARLHVVGTNQPTAGAAAAQTLQVTGGNGGTGTSTAGGAGSLIALQAGTGGTGGTSGGNGQIGGAGGILEIRSGTGGSGGDGNGAGGTPGNGAAGGNIVIQTGSGGTAGSDLCGGGCGGFGTNGAYGNIIMQSSGGNVSIGSATPNDKLDVGGNVRVGSIGGTVGCVVDRDGTGIAGACSSDERLKKNIVSNASVLESFGQLRIVNYNWRSDEFPERGYGDATQTGLIAQEVEALFPGLVGTDENGFKTVDFTTLGILNIQATTELNAKVNLTNADLSTKLSSLDERVTTLEAMMGSTGGGDFISNGGAAELSSLTVTGNTTTQTLMVTGAATVQTLTVTGDTSIQNLYVGGKLISRGAQPTIATGTALTGVLGASVVNSGTDTAGTVTINSGSQVSQAGILAEVTFTTSYSTTPKIVISGNNSKSSKLGAYVERTATGFKIMTDDPLAQDSTYEFDYIIISTQNN